MIIDFFRHGTGLSKNCLDYLLGKERDREHAQILSGDVELTAHLIDSSPFTKKYTAGCLSFYEHDLPEPSKTKIMQAFESCLFPEMDKDQYQILWVQHQDKYNEDTQENRLELNFVIPNIELTTGKRLQPFYAPVDMERVDLFKRIINQECQLHDPDDPENQQTLIVAKNLPQEVKAFKEKLHEYVCHSVVEGHISDRNTLVEWLEQNDLKVTRQTPKSISIENPCEHAKRPIRLSGEIYEQGFRADREYRQEIQSRVTAYRGTTGERHQNNLNDYHRQLERKSKYHRERYFRCQQKGLTNDSREYGADQRTGQSISNLARVFDEQNKDLERSADRKTTLHTQPRSYQHCNYSNYWNFSNDMDVQKQISRNAKSQQQLDRKTRNHRAPEYSRGEDQIRDLWEQQENLHHGKPQGRHIWGQWQLHDTDGVLNDDRTRNPTIEHYRKATATITNRLKQTRNSDENHQRVRALCTDAHRVQREIRKQKYRTWYFDQEITNPSTLRGVTEQLTDQFQTALGESFREINHRYRTQEADYSVVAEHGTRRNQGTDQAFSLRVFARERQDHGISQQPQRLNTETLIKAMSEAKQREELRQKQAQERERSSGYSMRF